MKRFTGLFGALRALSLIIAVTAACAGVATSELAAQRGGLPPITPVLLPQTPQQLRAVMIDLVFSRITMFPGEIAPQARQAIASVLDEAVTRVESDGMQPGLVFLAIRNTYYFTWALLGQPAVLQGRVSLSQSLFQDDDPAAFGPPRGICPLYPWC